MRLLAFGLALLVLVADQLSKWWIMGVLQLKTLGSVPLLPFLSLTWVENRGISMGLLAADSNMGRWLLVGVTGLIATLVAFWILRERNRTAAVALSLVLGGAIGNIIDRIRFGFVADFVHVHAGTWSFYVFNVADAAITIGVVLLLFTTLVGHSGTPEER